LFIQNIDVVHVVGALIFISIRVIKKEINCCKCLKILICNTIGVEFLLKKYDDVTFISITISKKVDKSITKQAHNIKL
jgi:hypothetical protein